MAERDPRKLFPHDRFMKPIVWLVPSFVHPNHLTIARMVFTPVVMWVLFMENFRIGIPLFVLVAFTDALDGSLARIRKQITEWGTFYDPVADKLLIGSVILLIVIQHVNPILAIAILRLEFLLMAGGWYGRQHGKIRSANIWGKIKMMLQFFGVFFLLISLWLGVDLFVEISNGTLILAVIFAIVSLLTYSL